MNALKYRLKNTLKHVDNVLELVQNTLMSSLITLMITSAGLSALLEG